MKKSYLNKLISSIVITSLIFTTTLSQTVVYGQSAVTPTIGYTAGAFSLKSPTITNATLAGRADVNLDWSDYHYSAYGDEVNTNYMVARRPVYYNKNHAISKVGDWEIRGKYGKTIKVLNLYPNDGSANNLKSWMDKQSTNDNVDIKVTPQKLNDFNSNPYRYLTKNADGSYNYDVIVFGFWDENGGASVGKLASSSANIVQDFIDAGYGVVFGHDTIRHTGINFGFNQIVPANMDLMITPVERPRWFVSNKIGIKKQGSLTTFPFDINGKDLTIPMSHSVNQLPANPKTGEPNNDIVYMTFEPNYYPTPDDGPYFNYNLLSSGKGPDPTVTYKGVDYIGNAYLYKQNNVAFIQCGHSNGQTSEAEQMVLANLMYALAQVNTGVTDAKDQVLDDISPSTPTDINRDLVFESEDSGDGYEYRIIAVPVGYDTSSIDKKSLQTALSSNVVGLNDKVKFSNSYITGELISGLKGSPKYTSESDQATYRYYINKKEVGTRIPNVEVPGKEDLKDDFFTLGYNQAFDYTKHYASVTQIPDDDYLHVVAFDRANNASSVANFRLKDLFPKTDVTIVKSYTNPDGKTQSISTTYLGSQNPSQIVGSKYSNAPSKNMVIDGNTYVYSHSNPTSKSITLSGIAGNNIITHYYDKLVTKKIYLVEERPEIDQGSSTQRASSENAVLYLTETVKVGETISIEKNRPDYSDMNYTYKGWTTGTATDYNKLNTSDEYLWADDSNDIYLYYEKDVATVNVEITRSDNLGFTDGGPKTYLYTRQGYVGEDLTITGEEIKTHVKVPNLQAFSNKSTLDNYNVTVTLEEKDATITKKIVLTPRTLNIKAIGIDYTTSPSAVSLIKTTTQTYKYDAKVPVEFPDTIDEWQKIVENTSSNTVELDFTTSKDVYVGYYKGVLPTEAYKVEANFINIVAVDGIPLKTITTKTLNVANSPNIPINNEVTIEKGNDLGDGVKAPRDVEFVLDHYEVKLNGDTTILSSDKDLNEQIPFKDANGNAKIGDYIVNVYYRPYSNIIYTEDIYNNAGTKVVSSKTTVYSALYDGKTKSLAPSQKLDEYSIDVVNGNFENNKISRKADAYDITVTTKYTPIVYNLIVYAVNKEQLSTKETVNSSFKNYNSYIFENIPIKNAVTFKPPNYESSGFYLDTAVMTIGDNADIRTNTKDKVVFDPVNNPTKTDVSYVMDLIYDQESTIYGTYTVYANGVAPLKNEVSMTAFIGDEVAIKIPAAEGYQLTSAYLDGKQLIEASTLTILNGTVTKPEHYIELIYHELKYNLSVTAVTSGGTVPNEIVQHYAGENIHISVEPDEGYIVEKVTCDDSSVVIVKDEGVENAYSISMPQKDVNLKVYFKLDDTPKDNIDDVGVSNDGDDDATTTDKEEVVEGNTDNNTEDLVPVAPEKPINPTPEDIYNLVNDPFYSVVRQYKTYISGYPDGNVKPSKEITRSEVIAIIYNLYGNGYVGDKSSLEKFTDVSADAWYSDAVVFSVDFGIINGYEDGSFKPNNAITRAELAAIIAKFVDIEVDDNIMQFSDVSTSWASDSIQKLYKQGIVSGYNDGTFQPKATTKRSEFISIVQRLIDRPVTFNKNVYFSDLPEAHWAYNAIMNAANGSVVDYDLPESILKIIFN